jgi:anti-sigma factor RsiW
VEPLLHAQADGELLAEERSLVLAHVGGCASCRARMDAILGLKAALREAGRAVELPDALLDRVRADLANEPPPRRAHDTRDTKRGWIAAALVGVGVAAGLALTVTTRAPEPIAPIAETDGDVIEAVVERHTRDVPVDVASPDPQSVAAFLEPRVGHGVAVPRLDPAGYGLFGGRIVDVHEQRTAQLVYRGGLGQKVSLVSVPDERGDLARRLKLAHGGITLVHHGHNLRVWSKDGAVHALVGDLAQHDLERLSSAIER